jgi:hypothetical protein
MMMILGSLATITDQVNKLVELLSIASPYARASFYANKHPHVVVCGSMTVVFYFLCFPADVLCCRLCFDARCLGLATLTTRTWLRRVFHFANAAVRLLKDVCSHTLLRMMFSLFQPLCVRSGRVGGCAMRNRPLSKTFWKSK